MKEKSHMAYSKAGNISRPWLLLSYLLVFLFKQRSSMGRTRDLTWQTSWPRETCVGKAKKVRVVTLSKPMAGLSERNQHPHHKGWRKRVPHATTMRAQAIHLPLPPTVTLTRHKFYSQRFRALQCFFMVHREFAGEWVSPKFTSSIRILNRFFT